MNRLPHLLWSMPETFQLGQDWRFGHPQLLILALAVPVLILVLLIVAIRTRSNQRLIADSLLLEQIAGKPKLFNFILHITLTTLVFVSVTIAIAQPQSDPSEVEVEARGRDVAFIVDVSRSMLVQDVAPSRLEKAKLWINDLVDELGNDRVALVAFAGSTTVVSPLTTDRLFFKLALEELSPQSVGIGGTNIGDAIRKTMDIVFIEDPQLELNNFRDIVLISDGEDQESLPIEAARQAGLAGARIIAIGIGSRDGQLVPVDRSSFKSNQQRVNSKLESGTLKAISAASPGGVYLEVGTGTIDLAQVYKELIATAEQRIIETSSSVQYTERFQFFLALGLIFIVLDSLFVSLNKRRGIA